jgi:hypothetical protein
MPSGKQILLAELQRLSQTRLSRKQLTDASERFRAALLLHGSTADSAWPTVERVAWIEQELGMQGPGLFKENIYLVELISALQEEAGIPEAVKRRYPDLTLRAYRAGLHVIRLLLTQFYFQNYYSSVENDGALDRDEAEKMIKNHIDKLHHYRRHPEEHIGSTVEDAESEI